MEDKSLIHKSSFIKLTPKGAISISRKDFSIHLLECSFLLCSSSSSGGAIFISEEGNVTISRCCASFCWTLITPGYDFGQFIYSSITKGSIEIQQIYSEFCGFGDHNMNGVIFVASNDSPQISNINISNNCGHETGGIYLADCIAGLVSDCHFQNVTTMITFGPLGFTRCTSCNALRLNYVGCINSSPFDPRGGSSNTFRECAFQNCVNFNYQYYELHSIDSTLLLMNDINQNICKREYDEGLTALLKASCTKLFWAPMFSILEVQSFSIKKI